MIDYVILTNTRTEKDYNMTMNLIDSLKNTIYPKESIEFSSYRITLVENNIGSGGFTYPNDCTVVNFDMSKYNMFNYNYAMNIGYRYCLDNFDDTDWFCALNNDVVCEQNWITEIAKAVSQNPQIESIGPNPHKQDNGIEFGYTLFQHMDGCCIMHRKSVLNKIGLWDETFDFAYQDDDYLERCRKANVVHARIYSCKIHHIGSATMDYTSELAMRGVKKFISKWSYEIFAKREKEKNQYKHNINLL